MDLEQFKELTTSRQRRSLKRGFTDAQKALMKRITAGENNVKTHCRDMVIVPQMVGKTLRVYNGKEYLMVIIGAQMVGHYLGEFSHTRKGRYPQRAEVSAQPDQAKLSQQGKEMAKIQLQKDSGHTAIARALNLPVSTKQCVEICRSLRFKDISYAKKFVEEVSLLKRAVPYKRSVMNIAHKAGMSAGRYPQKAKKEILRLLKSVEANAQAKGLDVSNLKITKILANRASIPLTGERHGGATKRTHVEVEVREKFAKKKAEAKKLNRWSKKRRQKKLKKPLRQGKEEIKSEIKPEIKTEIKHDHKPEIKSAKPVHNAEPSSEELLRRAQRESS